MFVILINTYILQRLLLLHSRRIYPPFFFTTDKISLKKIKEQEGKKGNQK